MTSQQSRAGLTAMPVSDLMIGDYICLPGWLMPAEVVAVNGDVARLRHSNGDSGEMRGSVDRAWVALSPLREEIERDRRALCFPALLAAAEAALANEAFPIDKGGSLLSPLVREKLILAVTQARGEAKGATNG